MSVSALDRFFSFRFDLASRAAALSFSSNLTLMILKLIVGILSGSIAVALQQASESFSDADYLSITANWLLLGFGGLICLVIAGMALNAQMGQRGNQEAEQVTSQEDNADS